MGKKGSVRRNARKNAQARSRTARLTDARHANARGSKVQPTLEGYEEAAKLGEQSVAEALIARHNQRMVGTTSMSESVRTEILSALVPICHLDMAALRLGADPNRPPNYVGNSLVENLAWGLDSVTAACRMLLCGQIAGAATLARNQIEAWTASRASAVATTKNTGEPDAEFIARVWSAPVAKPSDPLRGHLEVAFDSDHYVEFDDPEFPHKHQRLKNGDELCPASLWVLLSELLHARAYGDASLWDASCLSEEISAEARGAVFMILDALRLSLAHIRSLLQVIALDNGREQTAALLAARVEEFSVAGEDEDIHATKGSPVPSSLATGIVAPPLMFMAPLLPEEGLNSKVLEQLEGASSSFNGVTWGSRPIGRLYRDDELVTLAFGWHRFRSAVAAKKALDQEKDQFGERFDASGLQQRATAWLFVTEAASLVSLWTPKGPQRTALAVTGSALRSSWWLWLEDDDRAMASLRCVFEQIARLRVWRLKPEKGERLEARSTPRDWTDNAGWRRLGPLNSALGEFAHLTARSDWERARSLLTAIQDADDPETAPHTARRAALELVTLLAAVEIRERIRDLSPEVATAVGTLFTQLGVSPADEDRYIEERLNFIWSFRKMPYQPANAP